MNASMPQCWWEQNVPTDLNPTEIVQLVEGLTEGGHPALPQLRSLAQGYERARAKGFPEPTYRCPICFDSGLQKITAGQFDVGNAEEQRVVMVVASEDRPVYRRCRGVARTGCVYQAWRIGQLTSRAKEPRQGSRGDAL